MPFLEPILPSNTSLALHTLYCCLKTSFFPSSHGIVSWVVNSRKRCPCAKFQNIRMWHIWKRVFAGIINLRVLKVRSFWITWEGLNWTRGVLIRERQREIWHRDTQKGRPCKDRVRDWMMQPQAKECLEPQKPGRCKEESSPRDFRGNVALSTP